MVGMLSLQVMLDAVLLALLWILLLLPVLHCTLPPGHGHCHQTALDKR
jgi:hypothetical protein